MNKLGLKIWSTNVDYINLCNELYNKGVFNYIELYSVPMSFNKYIKFWMNLNIPYIIHAPHFSGGLNFSLREHQHTNLKLAHQAIHYADKLKATYIIFHPGVGGTYSETIYQIKKINDSRILIENKPYWGLHDELCVGHSPEEIKLITEEVRIGFCFDIGHAVCSANAKKIDPMKYINEFNDLDPVMYHLSDGDYSGIHDRHDHFGHGSFPIKDIIKIIRKHTMISIETIKNSFNNLDDFIADIEFLKNLGIN